MKEETTKVFALGGLGEVGKNMYCVMHKDEIIIVDSGVMFPEEDLLGIDYVIPDYTFLKENVEKIKALLITHGHEDHIGSIPFLLQTINIPKIYAPAQAKALIDKKLEEKNIKYNNMIIYNESTNIKTKYFNIEFFRTTHSIPDSHGIAIHSPNGTIVMTGDFKIDLTPIGPMSNIHKMARIGERGVKLLMSDSTNATVKGSSLSESVVDENLSEIFENEKNNRIILATFASNIYRLKHIIEICRKNKRKVALFGRSMDTSIDIAVKCGYIQDKKIIITPEEANRLKPSQVCLLCTGSQGEPLAALSRIANGNHRQIKLMPNDIVIFSSSPIPGNAASVAKTINKLYLKGVKVYTNGENEIHSSGHANQNELKLMIRLFKPEYFAPYHGEYRMLKTHCDLATLCDIPKENTFILANGDVLNISKNKVTKGGKVPAEDIYVDGSRIGDVGNMVIKDRKLMSSNGILVIIANIDINNRKLLTKPMITTRGYILVNENEVLIRQIEKNAGMIIENKLKNKSLNYNDLKTELINGLIPFLSDKTGRIPIILPIIMDIKNYNNEK
ncbi:MAG: ribonuclease J [Bacilli bacterium]|nr:ribonuclease J [Bacilli bacterium]